MTTELSEFLSATGSLKHDDEAAKTNAVIVALPRDLDPVRLVGDEEKHVTLAYFGEVSTLPAGAKESLLNAVSYVAGIFDPFGEYIGDVQRLGDDVPPALVAKFNKMTFPMIRGALLVDPALRQMLSNATQYPEYKPHMTFGYPDYAGEEELRSKAKLVHRVEFDRLALWWKGERYEFSLSANGNSELMMSEEMQDFLAHFGVKGMRWGVRKGVGTPTAQTRGTSDIDAHSNRSALQALSMKGTSSQAELDAMDSEIYDRMSKLDADSQAVVDKVNSDFDAERAKMDAEISAEIDRLSGNGTKGLTNEQWMKLEDRERAFDNRVQDAIDKAMKSIDPDLGDLIVKRLTSETKLDVWKRRLNIVGRGIALGTAGSILLMSDEEGESMTQEQLDDVDAFLAHHGVKGMRWGVKRDLKRMKPGERDSYIKGRDAKWLAKVEANPKLSKISAKAAREAKTQTKKLKADYKDRGLNIKKDSFARTRYDTELKGILENSLDNASYKVHKYSPTRLSEVAIHRHPDGSITALVQPRMNTRIVKQQGQIARADARRVKAEARAEKKAAKMAHADFEDLEDDFDELNFYITVDEEGFVDDITTPSDSFAMSDGDSYFEHASKTAIEKKLDAMKKKYGEKFFTMPLEAYVKEQPKSKQLKIMRSIVADVEQLKILTAPDAKSALAHAIGGLGELWEEAKVARDGLGQFASKASSLPGKGIDTFNDFSDWLGRNVTTTTTVRSTTFDGSGNRYESEGTAVERLNGDSYSYATTKVVDASGKVVSSGYSSSAVDITSLVPVPSVQAYVTKMNKLKHDEVSMVENFLAHFGVKGMRWGVRRSDAELAGTAGGRKSKPSDNADTDGDGTNDTRLSADAERTMKTLAKESHEMSDREMREAINRAKMIKEYKDTFESDKLEGAVKQLRLEKEFRNLQAELTPEKRSAVQKFTDTAAKGYAGYKQVDSLTGGKLTAAIMKKTGLEQVPTKSDLEKLVESNSVLSAQKTNLTLSRDVARMQATQAAETNATAAANTRSAAAKAFSNYAKTAVQDAKDLNNLVDDYLGTSSSKPKAMGPDLPTVGDGYYITRDGRFVPTTPSRKTK